MKDSTSEHVNLLLHHGIKPTANRILLVGALAEAGRPLSMMELEEQIESIDKSNIFRSLLTFKEHHLVHAIEDGSEAVRYELCRSHDEDRDDDMHVHFYCERCHKTFCLTGIPIPPVMLPEGYYATSANYVVKGICPDCAARGK